MTKGDFVWTTDEVVQVCAWEGGGQHYKIAHPVPELGGLTNYAIATGLCEHAGDPTLPFYTAMYSLAKHIQKNRYGTLDYEVLKRFVIVRDGAIAEVGSACPPDIELFSPHGDSLERFRVPSVDSSNPLYYARYCPSDGQPEAFATVSPSPISAAAELQTMIIATFPPTSPHSYKSRLAPVMGDATPRVQILAVNQKDTRRLYEEPRSESWRYFTDPRFYEHTMNDALDPYVEQRLPVEDLRDAIYKHDRRIEIHGIYPDHFPSIMSDQGLTTNEVGTFLSKHSSKRLNWVRPKFFTMDRDGKSVLAVAIIPGEDYFFHYASMIRHYAKRAKDEHINERIILYRYPTAEAHIAEWTNLASLIEPDDHVILGYVEEVETAMQMGRIGTRFSSSSTNYYTSSRYRIGNSTVNLLGVKFCFWGSISGRLARKICESGAQEIVYTGKLGTLTAPDDIYDKIFCPTEFAIIYDGKQVCAVTAPKNNVLERCDNMPVETGCHMSIPTILEETYIQRATAADIGAKTIDNEISQVAQAISDYNIAHEAQVGFSAIHFATDFLRDPKHRNATTSDDLATDKTVEARGKKDIMRDRIWRECLERYLRTL